MLEVGFSTEVITPKVPVKLAGYAGTRQATGVFDDLYAKAMVVRMDDSIYGLVSVDLLSVDDALVDYIRNKSVDLGFKKENIQVVATHTHSGPVGIHDTSIGLFKDYDFFLGSRDETYFEFVGNQIVKVLKKGLETQSAQNLKIGQIEIAGISSNRSRPELDYDNVLLVFEFVDEFGKKNLILRFANHPTVLDASNKLITADFVGNLYRRFSEQYENVIFVNGACGDISTRHTRLESGFREVNRIGNIIGGRAVEALTRPIYDGPFDIFCMASRTFNIFTKEPKDTADLKRQYDESTDEQEKISLYSETVYAKNQMKQLVNLSVSYVNIQGVHFVLMPVEIFSTLTLRYLEGGYFYTSFANGYYTYLPDEESYDLNEYEASMSPFARGEGKRVIEKVQAWVEELVE